MQQLSRKQIMQWYHLYELEPWGDHRADLRSLVSSRYNLLPHTKKGSSDRLPNFVYPYFEEVKEPVNTWDWVRRFHKCIAYDAAGRPYYLPGTEELFNGDQ